MPENQPSRIGDLSEFAQEIQAVFQKHFADRGVSKKEPAAMMIAFTLPEDYAETHWVTNVDRVSAIQILRLTMEKLQTNSN